MRAGLPGKGFVLPPGSPVLGWDLSARAVSLWTVAVYHSWVKGYHTVASVNATARRLAFGEPALFPLGDYVYCSDRRFYIENAPEIRLTPGSWKCGGGCGGAGGDGADVTLSYAPVDQKVWSGSGSPPPRPPAAVIPSVETLLELHAPNVSVRSVAVADTALSCPAGEACDADGAMIKYNAAAVSLVARGRPRCRAR